MSRRPLIAAGLAVAVAAAVLTGCVVVPTEPAYGQAYGYGSGYGYGTPYPAVQVAPPPVVVVPPPRHRHYYPRERPYWYR